MKRADRIAGSDRRTSPSRSPASKAVTRVQDSKAFRNPGRSGPSAHPGLVFSGTLYVDMVRTEVSSPVVLFLVCRERIAADSQQVLLSWACEAHEPRRLHHAAARPPAAAVPKRHATGT